MQAAGSIAPCSGELAGLGTGAFMFAIRGNRASVKFFKCDSKVASRLRMAPDSELAHRQFRHRWQGGTHQPSFLAHRSFAVSDIDDLDVWLLCTRALPPDTSGAWDAAFALSTDQLGRLRVWHPHRTFIFLLLQGPQAFPEYFSRFRLPVMGWGGSRVLAGWAD